MHIRLALTAALTVMMTAGASANSLSTDEQHAGWGRAESEAESLAPQDLSKIETVVVIYAENRSFDNLYGLFPGADGLKAFDPAARPQTDRDGSPLKELPPVWGGLPSLSEAQTAHRPNAPFPIDAPAPEGFGVPADVATRDLVHRFYQNRMQINGGRNDRFVAYGDSGALAMGYYDGSKLPLWSAARTYTLADNFFQAAFGGSFLNHFWLICACTPYYPDADKSPAKGKIAAVDADGVTLRLKPSSPASALTGAPEWEHDGALTPDFYAVNTMQPPYQPSGVRPAQGADPASADPADAKVLPPQTAETIGDLLSAKGVNWAWYAGAWGQALADPATIYNKTAPNFQAHHQPFNYFSRYAPGTTERARHLLDGGPGGAAFIEAIDAGRLPQVAFYKPQGNLNEHPGYADVQNGDRHIAEIIAHLEKSPQWKSMLVIVTYDENGGFWDHAAPPTADRWGPGTRIPALIVSPFARRGFVDHTPYDTTSVLRFLTRRFALPALPGLAARDAALKANGLRRPGDLTNALETGGR